MNYGNLMLITKREKLTNKNYDQNSLHSNGAPETTPIWQPTPFESVHQQTGELAYKMLTAKT